MFDIISLINNVRKNVKRNDIILLLFILILFAITRLVNLSKFPIFGDEGIYMRWAKVAWHDASWRFISLTDGKQPLQTWGTIPFLKLIPHNALLAGRLFSVSTGLFGLLGIFVTGFYLFGKRAAFIASVLYVFTPMFLFYDRMSLVDSGVNAFAIWILFFSILLARTVRLDIALIFGLLSGMALLAKSSVRLFLGLGYLAIILMKIPDRRTKTIPDRHIIRQIVNFSILYLLSSIIALVLYNIQRLSPFFHYVAEKNKTFIMTFDELLKTPFANFFNNIKIIPYYVFSEIGYILGFLGILGLLLLFKKDKRLTIYLASWIVIPFFIIAFVSKVIFPRYLIFMAGILTITASYFLTTLDRKKLQFTALFIALSIFYFDYTLMFDFTKIPFPAVDKGQYIEGVTAGWGIPDIIAFARQKSAEKPVKLLAEGDFGVIGDQLDVFMYPGDKIEMKGYWPLKIEDVIENQKELKDRYVYVVFSHQKELPIGWPIRLIKEYKKPGGQASIFFAEVLE